jgi:hypothetical protein
LKHVFHYLKEVGINVTFDREGKERTRYRDRQRKASATNLQAEPTVATAAAKAKAKAHTRQTFQRALLAIALNPRRDDYEGPANKRAAQAHKHERDNVTYLVHA